MCIWNKYIVPTFDFDNVLDTSQTDQIVILDKFRRGELQGIVATTVAEEGIDIPDCNLVINYNYIGNEISSKQSKGRSNIIVL
jgi:ERCC4-related helicase